MVFKRKVEKISQAVLEEAIAQVEPTVSADTIAQCERIRDEFTRKRPQRPRVGFK